MSQKNIQPERIKSIKASISASSDELTKGASTFIEAPVTEILDDCAKLAESCMTKLAITVESLDAYLNSVAEAFQNADEAMAQSISQNLYTQAPKETPKERRERYIQEGNSTQEKHARRKQMDLADKKYQDFP